MNWWLLALSFVLGMVLTGAFVIRRVTGEAPAPAPAAPIPKTVAPQRQTIVEESPPPHGPGSARPGAGGVGPQGWTVKGNEESKLYHSPESPSFGVTRAEVWFRDVETAEAAGFNRWDSGKSQRGRT